MKAKNGLNDSDKIFIAVALWIAMVALFATAMSLSRLPEMVTIFYKPTDLDISYYSKYNDLLIALISLIPTVVIIVVSELKRRGRVQHNFPSILLFCIMLSICFGGVAIYGLYKQFEASSAVRSMDLNEFISLFAAFVLSLVSALVPTLVHSPSFVAAGSRRSTFMTFFCSTLDSNWIVGMYLFLLSGIASSFIPGYYSYIPLAVFFVGYVVYILVRTRVAITRNLETVLFDTIDSNTSL